MNIIHMINVSSHKSACRGVEEKECSISQTIGLLWPGELSVV